jgi:hypothetical protein
MFSDPDEMVNPKILHSINLKKIWHIYAKTFCL